jgi:hypothetical protein
MADNRIIKDGLGNTFYLRMKDISPGGDGQLQRSMVFASLQAPDYGIGGSYQHLASSGSIGTVGSTGLNSAPIYSFQWHGTTTPPYISAMLRRFTIGIWTGATGFAAGVGAIYMTIARNFTGTDTGGNIANLTGNNGKLNTKMNASLANIVFANTATITPGTRTLDAQPIAGIPFQAPTTGNTIFTAQPMVLYDKSASDFQLTLNQNEGFVVQATVPAGGPWSFVATTIWDELVN